MGTTTFSGPVVSNNGFVGSVTGNVTGTTGTFADTVTVDSGTAPVAGGAAAVLMTSTANLGIFVGSGAPTVTAAQGSLYLRTDGTTTNDRVYVRGSAAWIAITTAT